MASTSSFFRAPTRVQLREWLDGYMFALPFIIGFLVFFLFPMGYSAWLAVSFGAHPVNQLQAEAPLACVDTPAELRAWLEANA